MNTLEPNAKAGDLVSLCCKLIKESSPAPEDLTSLKELLKDLRVQATDYEKQGLIRESFVEKGFKLYQLAEIFNLVRENKHEDIPLILSYGFQFLINFSNQNAKNREYMILTLILNEDAKDLAQIIEKFLDDKKLQRFTLILFNNIITNSEDKIFDALWINKHKQFYEIMSSLISRIFRSEFCSKDVKDHGEDELFEWSYIILKNLIMRCLKLEVYTKERSIVEEIIILLEQRDEITKTQEKFNIPKGLLSLHFLFFLDNALTKTINERSHPTMIREIRPKSADIIELYSKNEQFAVIMNKIDLKYLNSIYIAHAEEIITLIGQIDKQTLLPDPQQTVALNHNIEFAHAILRLLCSISFLGGYNTELQQFLWEESCVKSSLNFCRAIFLWDQGLQNQEPPKALAKIIQENAFFELYLNFLRFFSNLVHINRALQDFILDNNYLIMLLNFTGIDENNPYIREWSIVLIRNLTESNERIQEKIAQLKVQDFDKRTKELLKKMNLSDKEKLQKKVFDM